MSRPTETPTSLRAVPEKTHAPMPAVPYTLDGAALLHQMITVRWEKWHALGEAERQAVIEEATAALAELEATRNSAVFSMLGHKGDLMLVHFRNSFDELNQVEMRLNSLCWRDYFDITHSYLSVVELGLYASTSKMHAELSEKGFVPHSAEWNEGVEETLVRQRKAMAPRLWPEVPPNRYCCFYPMDRYRGEEKNWYMVPLADRQRMMHDHGMIGRRYAGEVKQIISGSIGFDKWEWGVDLFADDPIVFKKLIYEMRFDEVSAVYGLFGDFFVGLRFDPAHLGDFFAGKSPAWEPPVEPEDTSGG
ncbi:MAG: hydrogen peroxide-dependent heme synthase [Bryobacterales bacterium]|nr:hydrogen peroxide-dependent heme synthase [Bryobacterales bacterium]